MGFYESGLERQENEFKKQLGKKIKDHRSAIGLSQHQLALEANISRTQISRLENGEINTSVIGLLRVAKALNLNKEQLLDLLER
ncbi:MULTISPECIES: helix-turn-helix domain-containing protein [Flavobacteriaceae]|uniref:helix-turn-helix domain-containing protein n=1 Tax=Flavobacteriaceae TaxID=49546 RepID=UPI00234A7043|nr:helix-turn-helix transcriptional regulator [Muricauda sp. SP22]MDC6361852.1 helix-turn-helix transcriptional regulator [Muricauda sp. SP22]